VNSGLPPRNDVLTRRVRNRGADGRIRNRPGPCRDDRSQCHASHEDNMACARNEARGRVRNGACGPARDRSWEVCGPARGRRCEARDRSHGVCGLVRVGVDDGACHGDPTHDLPIAGGAGDDSELAHGVVRHARI
jgi:hypothetical protein